MTEMALIQFPQKNGRDDQLHFEIPEKLEDFLMIIDNEYRKKISTICMFNTQKSAAWSYEQKQTFVKLFYHVRGHFYKFLWCIGSTTTDSSTKQEILENIQEEFGGEKKSHEDLYLDFAQFLGVNLRQEIYDEKFYLPFLREFDRNHIKWIVEHNSEPYKIGIFSAYERLDNIDYLNLLNLAKSIGVSQPEVLTFFLVHSNASHFERLNLKLNKIWKTNPQDVVLSFIFIYTNQLNMWKELSNHIMAP